MPLASLFAAVSPAIPAVVAHIATPIGWLLAALAVLAGCLVWMGLYPLRRWRYRHFPGPFGLPFLGNLPQLAAMDITGYLLYGAKKYGPIYKIWFGTRPWLVISDPDLVRKIGMQSTARPPDMATYLDVLTGEARETGDANIIFQHGEAWRRSRRAFEVTVVHPSSLAAHLPVITSCLGRFVPSLERYAASGRPVDIHKALGDLLLEITGELAYGVDFGVDFYEDTPQDGHEHLSKRPGKQPLPRKEPSLGAALAQACHDIIEAMWLDRVSIYLIFQLVFPTLRPVIQFLAHYFPDPNLRRAMQANSTIIAVSRQLVRQWAKAKQHEVDALPADKMAADTRGVTVGSAPDKGGDVRSVSVRSGADLTGSTVDDGTANGITANGKTVNGRTSVNGSYKGTTLEGLNGVSGGAAVGDGDVRAAKQFPPATKQLLREVGGGVRGSSFLAAMLEGRKGAKQEDRLSEVEVLAQCMTFILAAFETTSNTTSLALLLLATHPEAQKRMMEEVEGVAGRDISPEMLAGQLPYTEAVLKETMRLYPPVPMLNRHVKADIDLGGGRMVPRGAFLALSNYNLQHDPALWPEPERFLPERFLPGGAASSAHPAAWAGFGMGPRMCVGHKLAMMLAQATLLSLLRRYNFELAPGQQPRPAMATGATFGPQNGVRLLVRSRGAA